MAYQSTQTPIERVESATDIQKRDLAKNIIYAEAASTELHDSYEAGEPDPMIKNYRLFRKMFWSVFMAAKDNIEDSHRVVGWNNTVDKDGKEIQGLMYEYNSFLGNRTYAIPNLMNIEFGLRLFSKFLGILVQSGLYSLIIQVGEGEEGLMPNEPESEIE